MKAIVVQSPLNMRVEEVPTPRVRGPKDVLIRVISGSICGSDVGILRGTNALATYPRIIGHEFCGRVVEIGAEVTETAVGDIVAVDPVRSCGHCYACRIGRPNVCREVAVSGVHRDGGFAEYALADAANCHKINADLMPADYGCFVEPFSIGVQVCRRAEVTADDRVVVMGSGPIGICVMQVARAYGAKVLMTDLLDERIARAKACGADVALNAAKESVADAVAAFTDGEGAPVVVDTVCSQGSLAEAAELASPAGRVVVMGLLNKPSPIAQVAITKKELTLIGSRLNNHRFPEVISLIEQGKIFPDQICSATFPFEQAEEAFRLVQEHPESTCKVRLMF